mmetsp:Transcript_6533/g.19080  ORF Transcript_6533/g.19080 Transcript_6533/m.19080 type:complete len:206 (-) Transcript_6533:226-843(-)
MLRRPAVGRGRGCLTDTFTRAGPAAPAAALVLLVLLKLVVVVLKVVLVVLVAARRRLGRRGLRGHLRKVGGRGLAKTRPRSSSPARGGCGLDGLAGVAGLLPAVGLRRQNRRVGLRHHGRAGPGAPRTLAGARTRTGRQGHLTWHARALSASLRRHDRRVGRHREALDRLGGDHGLDARRGAQRARGDAPTDPGCRARDLARRAQ